MGMDEANSPAYILTPSGRAVNAPPSHFLPAVHMFLIAHLQGWHEGKRLRMVAGGAVTRKNAVDCQHNALDGMDGQNHAETKAF
jgi:hypothetical protein